MGIAVVRRSISSLPARLFPPSRPFCLVCSRQTVFSNSSLSAGRRPPSAPAICGIARNFVSSWTMHGKPHLLASEMPMMHQFRHSIKGTPEKAKAEGEQFGSAASTKVENFIKSKIASYHFSSKMEREAYIEALKCIMKYNLFKIGNSVDEVFARDEFLRELCYLVNEHAIKKELMRYKSRLESYLFAFVCCLFEEHLVKHCGHKELEAAEIWKFKQTFPILSTQTLHSIAKKLLGRCHALTHMELLPQDFKDHLLSEAEKEKEMVRSEYGRGILDKIIREIEEGAIKKYNQEIVARGDSCSNSMLT